MLCLFASALLTFFRRLVDELLFVLRAGTRSTGATSEHAAAEARQVRNHLRALLVLLLLLLLRCCCVACCDCRRHRGQERRHQLRQQGGHGITTAADDGRRGMHGCGCV
jgi:hypothetical protein